MWRRETTQRSRWLLATKEDAFRIDFHWIRPSIVRKGRQSRSREDGFSLDEGAIVATMTDAQ